MKMKAIDYQGFILFIMLLFLNSCVYTEQANKHFLTMLNKNKNNLGEKIRFDGCYHRIRGSSYNRGMDYKNGMPTRFVDTPYVDQPIFFFSNGLIGYSQSLYIDSSKFNAKLSITKSGSFDWGTYDIVQDTVKAIIYMDYWGSSINKRFPFIQTYFQGILHNKDTIKQWQMIPPYPKVDEELNKDVVESLKEPKDIYFKAIPAEAIVDADSAWINEFRGLREADLKGGKKRRKKYP